jgi:hypothetical protein
MSLTLQLNVKKLLSSQFQVQEVMYVWENLKMSDFWSGGSLSWPEFIASTFFQIHYSLIIHSLNGIE